MISADWMSIFIQVLFQKSDQEHLDQQEQEGHEQRLFPQWRPQISLFYFVAESIYRRSLKQENVFTSAEKGLRFGAGIVVQIGLLLVEIKGDQVERILLVHDPVKARADGKLHYLQIHFIADPALRRNDLLRPYQVQGFLAPKAVGPDRH